MFFNFSKCPEPCGDDKHCCGGERIERPCLSKDEVQRFKKQFRKDYNKYIGKNNKIKRNKLGDCVFLNTDKMWGDKVGCIFSKKGRPIECLTLPVFKDVRGIYAGKIIMEDFCPLAVLLISKFKKSKNKLKKGFCIKCNMKKTCCGNILTSPENIMFPFVQTLKQNGKPEKGTYILDASCPITKAILIEEIGTTL